MFSKRKGRLSSFGAALFLLLASRPVKGDFFDCGNVVVKGESGESRYNLTGVDSVDPSRPWMITRGVGDGQESFYVRLCGALTGDGGCPKDTLVCGKSADGRKFTRHALLEQVDPLTSVGSGPTDQKEEKPFDLELKGEDMQKTRITFVCSTEKAHVGPTLLAYNGEVLHLNWRSPLACQKRDGNPPDKNEPGNEPVSPPSPPLGPPPPSTFSSILSFLTTTIFLALLALALYFAIGIWHNYSQYGARGLDLIPHRDFWQEVPSLFGDLTSRCFGRGGPSLSNRNGYQAV